MVDARGLILISAAGMLLGSSSILSERPEYAKSPAACRRIALQNRAWCWVDFGAKSAAYMPTISALRAHKEAPTARGNHTTDLIRLVPRSRLKRNQWRASK